MNRDELHNLRSEYRNQELEVSDLHKNPMTQFTVWFQEAVTKEEPEPNAFSLATVSELGKPSNRIVLVKEIRENGFVFYTNYKSRKGNQIAGNENVSACFFWQSIHKQVRIEGTCHKILPEESDAYFQQRPLGSRIGAATSPQSEVIDSRQWLEDHWKENQEKFGENIQRPEFWGGYIILPSRIEFWQGQPSRLHDRFLYEWMDEAWVISRLAP